MYYLGMASSVTLTPTATLTHTAALARLGYALSDPTRSRILLALRADSAQPSQLADDLGVTRQSVSNHLACLRGCGLVAAERQGRSTNYRLADPALAPALTGLLELVLTVDPACCSSEGCSCA